MCELVAKRLCACISHVWEIAGWPCSAPALACSFLCSPRGFNEDESHSPLSLELTNTFAGLYAPQGLYFVNTYFSACVRACARVCVCREACCLGGRPGQCQCGWNDRQVSDSSLSR